MIKSSWFLSFIDLYDRDPSAMIQEYKDNNIEYMIKKYTISKSTIMKYLNTNHKKYTKVDYMNAKKMRDDWISDVDIAKHYWISTTTIWMRLGSRKKKAEKQKRIWREFIEVKEIPKVSWINKEEKPYYDTSNMVEMWPCKAFYIKFNYGNTTHKIS